MHIRLATEADIPAVLKISNWAALHTPANFAIEPEPLDDWLRSWRDTHRMHPWLVAVDDEGAGIVGFAKSSPHRGRCAYAYTAEVSVYVHHEHHGRGIGSALYQRLIPILRAQGYCTLLAGITVPNPASQRLHEALGFRRVATYERVGWKFNRWHDVGYWQLHLNSNTSPPKSILSVEQVMTRDA
jgi:phosphinothricin acetyltransferase